MADSGTLEDEPTTIVSGIAWYDKTQYQLLQVKAADADELHDSYEDWRHDANQAIAAQRQAGVSVKKVAIKVDEVIQWCEAQGRPFDISARSHYVSEYLRRQEG